MHSFFYNDLKKILNVFARPSFFVIISSLLTAEIDSFEYDFSENKGFTVIFYKKQANDTSSGKKRYKERQPMTTNDNNDDE